jgi:hypothetical protein
MHTHRMWFATKDAVVAASEAARFATPRYALKPMSGFFATVFSLQVRSAGRGRVMTESVKGVPLRIARNVNYARI